MRAVIIGNGNIFDYTYIKSKIAENDFIICADGGYNHALRMGITPDLIIGDFDSADIRGCDVKKIEYPTQKDFTDGELAVEYAVNNGFDNIILLAMTGNRFDHTITDILLLRKCPRGVLIDDNNEIYLLRDNLHLSGTRGQTISIIPINGNAEGINTKGLKYPLNNETLYFGASRGVSNVMTDDECEITLSRGLALAVKVRVYDLS